MYSSKNFLKSKTIWGVTVMLVLFLFTLFTGDAPPEIPTDMPVPGSAVNQETGEIDWTTVLKSVAAFAAWALTVWGRFAADAKVKVVGS